MVNDVDVADGHAVGIFRPGIDFRHGAFHETLNGHAGPPRAPFFTHHAALFVDFRWREVEVVTPVAQNEQAGVDHAFTHHGG